MPSPTTSVNSINHASLEQAAQWYVQLNDQQVGEQERQRWQAWLAQSGEHQAAWRYVERVGERFAPLHGDGASPAASQALRGTGRTSVTRRQALKSLLILTSGSLLGLTYNLALSSAASVGTGLTQNFTINGTIAGGQAGTCASASCSGSQTRTLLLSW